MLKRFLCWLLGHQFVVKAFTRRGARSFDDAINNVHYFIYETQRFCPRCGCRNPNL